MKSKQIVGTALFLAMVLGSAAHAQFIPGDVYVADPGLDYCHDYWDRIWRIDPRTGQVSLFVERTGDDCGRIMGLAFTPDGTRLRTAESMKNRIVEFDADGNETVVLDASDNISFPEGWNGLAYDSDQNFYVLNSGTPNIMKFPPGGGPGTVFADANDGITGGGAMAFVRVAELNLTFDLYYADIGLGNQIRRITPQGVGILFDDDFPGQVLLGLATGRGSDGRVYLYAGVNTGDIYRYEVGVVSSKELLASGTQFIGQKAMAMSPFHSELWLVVQNKLLAIDLSNAAVRTLADITEGSAASYGIAVVPGTPPPIPAASQWGLLVLVLAVMTAGTLVLMRARSRWII